ncbi:uncharacterized protein LOC131934824 [Physella acuta]|uniref:uncharacterized protein LOC131934824 n=1 Tax=Physella acuta TaxID=109671 RepID=UPI0027DD1726|nr:uncharacterized protein LOC131934824 [Physella acuta]
MSGHHAWVVVSLTTIICWLGVDAIHDTISPRYVGSDEATSTKFTTRTPQGYLLPYVDEILFPDYMTKDIIIEGSIPTGSKSFSVNLCNTKACNATLPLELAADFNEKILTKTSKVNSSTMRIEKEKDLPIPRGSNFTLRIAISNIGFIIYVNDHHFTTYTLLTSIHNIKFIQVKGSVVIDWILFSTSYPTGGLKIEKRPGGEKIIVQGYPISGKKTGYSRI